MTKNTGIRLAAIMRQQATAALMNYTAFTALLPYMTVENGSKGD